jgi:hypothetical protein
MKDFFVFSKVSTPPLRPIQSPVDTGGNRGVKLMAQLQVLPRNYRYRHILCSSVAWTGINLSIHTWIITNTMHHLSSVYWVITPLHVSGVSAAQHQEVECTYVANGTYCTSELTVSEASWPADSQLRSIKGKICHICTFYLLMMGCWYARNM